MDINLKIILLSEFSDQNEIKLDISNNTYKQVPSIWKLNNTLFKIKKRKGDKEAVTHKEVKIIFNEVIRKIKLIKNFGIQLMWWLGGNHHIYCFRRIY